MTEQRTREQFMAAVKDLTAWEVAKAMNTLTPGVNWKGCSKGHMAESWVRNDAHYRGIERVDPTRLKEIILVLNARPL